MTKCQRCEHEEHSGRCEHRESCRDLRFPGDSDWCTCCYDKDFHTQFKCTHCKDSGFFQKLYPQTDMETHTSKTMFGYVICECDIGTRIRDYLYTQAISSKVR